jgi:hypothetical protein
MDLLVHVMKQMVPFFEAITTDTVPTSKGFTYDAVAAHIFFSGNGINILKTDIYVYMKINR